MFEHLVLAAATQTWWQDLLHTVWVVFLELGVPVLVTLLLVLLNRWLHISLGDKQRALVDVYVSKAVDYADQKLKKVLHEGDAPKDKNAARMQWAMSFLEQTLVGTGLLKKAEAKLEDLIEAKLGQDNRAKKLLSGNSKKPENKSAEVKGDKLSDLIEDKPSD